VTEVAALAALVDTASAAQVSEVEATATARDDVAAEVTPPAVVARPYEATQALPDAATTEVEPAPAQASEATTAVLSSDVAASVAVSDLVAAPEEGAPAAQVADTDTPATVASGTARLVAPEETPLSVADAAGRAIAEAPAVVSDTFTPAAIADDVVVAASEQVLPPMPVVRPAIAPVEPAPAPTPEPAKSAPPPAKPVKPAKPAKPATAASAASVAEQAAQGPKLGNAGAGGVSADERGKASLSDYRSKVAARLRRARSYPAAARAENLTGTATVTFTINTGGGVGRASLAKSSGHRILDQAALDMVARAAPFPPLPAGAGNSITITVPVRFDTN
jgi:protein TonB